MTEAEWFACTDPVPMIQFHCRAMSDRKLRLFAVAVARLLSHHLPEDLGGAVDVGERLADGLASEEERLHFVNKLYGVVVDYGRQTGQNWLQVNSTEDISAKFAALKAVGCWRTGADVSGHPGWDLARLATAERQPHLLRDMFGNPFHPVFVDPSWQTPPVLALATDIYQDRAFDRMPILADALQTSGCNNADIITHCHLSESHVRGCWVVDKLLGKE